MDSRVSNAKQFATRAHRRIDHLRVWERQPHPVHLKAVAQLLASVTDDRETIAVAWLHDTAEDTAMTVDDIRAAFGVNVASLLADLAEIGLSPDILRPRSKPHEWARAALPSPRSRTVRLADLLDNCLHVHRTEPHVAKGSLY